MTQLRVLACVLFCACGAPSKDVLGPRSGDGVELESARTRSRTKGFWSNGCWLEGTIKNHTDELKLVQVTVEARVLENRGISFEKHGVTHIAYAVAEVAARDRRAYEARLPTSSCDKLVTVTIQNITATSR